jgi:hypothetical protein
MTATTGRFTKEQRDELRAAIDQSKCEALAESRRLAGRRPVKSPVVRAAEKAQRAQEAPALARTLLSPSEPHRSGRCVYCGARCPGRACVAHSDLNEPLAHVSNDPAPTPLAEAGTGSQTKGA